MFVLDFSHSKLRAGIALDHDRESRKRSVGWVVIDIGLVDEDDSLGESGIGDCLLDFGVVFVDELALGGDRWVDISIGVIDIRHLNCIFRLRFKFIIIMFLLFSAYHFLSQTNLLALYSIGNLFSLIFKFGYFIQNKKIHTKIIQAF